jgi:outer membrane receptor protein involved in Fe transport
MNKFISKFLSLIKIFHLGFISIIAIHSYSYAQKEVSGDKLLDLTLDELMNISVKTGNITGIESSKTPVSITTITANDLAVTPARNLYDILETYVPGAIFLLHWDSPHLGMRGIITDRNYKYLLLVNGRNMNLKAHNGATSELELWDLSDIEKIEVIRGPGSVTYGPGAVAGIINITTKSGFENNGLSASANYIYPYNSKGIKAEYSKDFGKSNLFLYGSIQSTSGYENPKIYSQRPTQLFDVIGSESKDVLPIDYYSDYGKNPNVKLNAEYNFSDNWSLNFRYTRQGQTQNPTITKSRPQSGYDSLGFPTFGDPIDILQTRDQHITLNLRNESKFEFMDLSSMISLSSEEYIRNTGWFRGFWNKTSIDTINIFNDINNLYNHDYDFSESSVLGRFIGNKQLSDNINIAAGTEISLNYWGPGWGKDRKNFRLGDNYDIISGTDSYVYGCPYLYTGVPAGKGYFVGNGWSTLTTSFLYELFWKIDPRLSILISGRNDKDSYSQWLFSPRIAFISELSEHNIAKLVFQRSQRMNTAAQLLIQHQSGISTDPETLTGIELLYTGLIPENCSINSSLFYNDLDVISWVEIGRSTQPTGNLKLFGIEFEVKLNLDNFNISMNHTYTKQFSWKLKEGVQFSGISFSDYHYILNNITLSSVGNDLNNWSNNATKLILNYKLFDDKLLMHLNAHLFWNFEGSYDGIEVLENSLKASDPNYKVTKDLIESVKKQDIFGADFRLNYSIVYNFNKNLGVSLYVMNLLGYGNNKRYVYDAGHKGADNLVKTAYVEEPRTIGFKINYNY